MRVQWDWPFLLAGNVQSLEIDCHCHAFGILRQHLHGLNRFPCLKTWAERSLGAAHAECMPYMCIALRCCSTLR